MSLQYDTSLCHTPKGRKAASLFRFLTDSGGLKPCGELRVILDGKHGWMVRKSGMSLDRAREACVEAGYLRGTPWECGIDTSTINDLLELIDAEARGVKQYPEGEWPEDDREYPWGPSLDDSGEDVGAPSPDHAAQLRPVRETRENGMTAKQYLDALAKLKLTASSKRTAAALGIQVRQSQRYAAGEQPVSAPVAKLLRLMIRERLSPEDVAAL